MTHEVGRNRHLAAQHPAQLADHAAAPSVVQVDLLADQRRAPAVDAAVAIRLQGADAMAQQQALGPELEGWASLLRVPFESQGAYVGEL